MVKKAIYYQYSKDIFLILKNFLFNKVSSTSVKKDARVSHPFSARR